MDKRLLHDYAGRISAREQTMKNSLKSSNIWNSQGDWIVWLLFWQIKQCVQLQMLHIPIDMQVRQKAGLWTQLSAPWLEGRGESAIHSLKWPNSLSVTHTTFSPMVYWSGRWCFTRQAQIQTDTLAQCCSDSLFWTERDRMNSMNTCRMEWYIKFLHSVKGQTLFQQ